MVDCLVKDNKGCGIFLSADSHCEIQRCEFLRNNEGNIEREDESTTSYYNRTIHHPPQ